MRELEKRKLEIDSKINKLKSTNSVPMARWTRPTKNAYLLELCKNESAALSAKERLKDKNRPLYETSLTGESNATEREVLELLKVTKKPIYYRYGFA